MIVSAHTKIAALAHRAVLTLVILLCVLALAQAQDFADDMDEASMPEELPGAVDVARRRAPPPRTLDNITQALLTLIEGSGYVDATSGQTLFSYAHPLFWAPFRLVGDGAGRELPSHCR